MDADENPYESPLAGGLEDVIPPEDPNEQQRRLRVAMMWAAYGASWLVMPWWAGPLPATGLLLVAWFGTLVFTLTLVLAAIGVAVLGKPRDLLGAFCCVFLAAGWMPGAWAALMLVERFLGVGIFF